MCGACCWCLQARALKRPRLVWTPQLHSLFEDAVQKLGLDKAVPKTIMQVGGGLGGGAGTVLRRYEKHKIQGGAAG